MMAVTTRLACAAGILALGLVHGTAADEAYWHGVRSDDWNQGLAPGGVLSNWYSEAPPNGDALKVPSGTAIFAPGALKTNLRITQDTTIARVRFEADAPLYTFRLMSDKELIISRGLINQSATVTPRFTLLSGARMEAQGEARFVSAGAASSASVETLRKAFLYFIGSSRGGNAAVVNNRGGTTIFNDNASAEQMTITNRIGGRTFFSDRSTGDRAHVVNEQGGLVRFTSRGPAGDSNIPIGKIDNDGEADVSIRTLVVRGGFTQTANGTFVVFLIESGAGGLVVKGLARLDGRLYVAARSDSRPGIHKIVQAAGGRIGKFASLEFHGADHLTARLAYSGTEVNLIIRRK